MRVALAAAALLFGAALPALADGTAPVGCLIDPPREGKRITDERQLIGFGITASQVALHDSDKKGVLLYAEPQWCEQSEFAANGQHFVLWHNLSLGRQANLSGPFDRLTRAGRDPNDSGAIFSLADRLAPTMHKDGDPPTPAIVYHIMLDMKDEIWIVGSYDQPPSAEELARFGAGGAVPINVRIDKKTRNTTLYRPT